MPAQNDWPPGIPNHTTADRDFIQLPPAEQCLQFSCHCAALSYSRIPAVSPMWRRHTFAHQWSFRTPC